MRMVTRPLTAMLSCAMVSVATAAPPASLPASRPALNARLAAMGDNTWLNLKPEGMAKARTYSGACFGGGLLWYFGGAHGSYPCNDVQLYDPRANRWIQATEPEAPPRGSAEWKTLVSGGGTSRSLSPKGRPLTEHTYQQACWLPERRRFFLALVSSGTWQFDPGGPGWEHLTNRLQDPRADPRGAWAQNHVLYEPAWKAPVLTVGGGGPDIAMFRFDHDAKRWVRLGPTPDVLKWNEFYSTYVPDWKCHLLATSRKGFLKFDVPARGLTPVESPDALQRCQSLSYDAANHVVIALATKEVDRYRRTVTPWALDVRTMKWREMNPPSPAPVGQSTGSWAALWYDADHNVHLLVNFVKRDRDEQYDGGVTETWAYRYSRKAVVHSGSNRVQSGQDF